MHAARAQPGEMPLADQQPGRRGLLLLRERASQRIALLPGARAHCVSVGRSAAQQPPRDAMIHSITSSAATSNVCGIARPSAFVVLRLTTSSNFTVCWTGKSPGFSPLTIDLTGRNTPPAETNSDAERPTAWLTMQSAAAPNSLLTGKLTGNFAESGPLLTEQGIFAAITGNFFADNREFNRASRISTSNHSALLRHRTSRLWRKSGCSGHRRRCAGIS